VVEGYVGSADGFGEGGSIGDADHWVVDVLEDVHWADHVESLEGEKEEAD